MRGDNGEPLGVGRLLVRVLLVPGLIVAVALGGLVALLGALQGHPRTSAVSTASTTPATSQPPARRTAPDRLHTAASSRRRRVRPARTPHAAPLLGVYAGPGDVTGAGAFSALVPTKVTAAFDYLDDRSWSSIASPSWLVDRWAPTGDAMTYAVPMLPATGASLAAGASGAYDAEFDRLASFLVAHGEASATLVLGWSPLEHGLPWSVSGPAEAADYVAYFRHIVRTMRAVPGAGFVFAFQPGPVPAGRSVGPARLYPGNAYVDVVATQVFDQLSPPSPLRGVRRWAKVRTVPFGPAWMARFAARRHRRLLVDGFSLVPVAAGGGGDNAAFVAAFFAWARQVGATEVIVWGEGGWSFSPARDPRGFASLRRLIASRPAAVR